MASLFDGLQTQSPEAADAAAGNDPPANPSAGGDLFGSLSVGGAGAAESGGPGSAFSFLNSGNTAASEVSSSPFASSTGESAFSFLKSADTVQQAPQEAFPGLQPAAAESSAPPLSSFGGETSAFSFLSGGSQPSASVAAPQTLPSEPAGALDAAMPPLDTAPRKKTRKALLPGHAGRQEAASSVPPPPPSAPELPSPSDVQDEGPAPAVSPEPLSPASKPPPPAEPLKPASPPAEASKPPPPPLEQRKTEPADLPSANGSDDGTHSPPQAEQPVAEHHVSTAAAAAEVVRPRMSLDAFGMGGSAGAAESPSAEPSSFQPPSRPLVTEPTPAPVTTPTPQPAPTAAQKPPPPPEPPLSPSQKLQKAFNVGGVRQWLQERFQEGEKEQRHLLEEQAGCLAASQRTADNITALRIRLEKTEADQNSLCDNEQFEEAGALDLTIQELKDTISKQLEEVATGARQMEALAKQLLSTTRDRAAVASQAQERIKDLRQESEEAFSSAEERSRRRLQAEQARIESERKRMGLARSHLEKDSDNLKEEWQQVTEAIDQQTTEHVEERDKAGRERAALDEEIQELQRLLEKKLEQRKALTEVVDSCEIRIASIRSKFEKQLSRLEGKQKRLEEAQREVEVDSQQVVEMETTLQREEKELKEQADQHRHQLRDIRTESRALRKQRRFVAQNVQLRVVWQKLMEPCQDALNQARQAWESITHKCVELSASSASQEAEAAKLRSQIDAAVQALPGLEAEKKLAVASRSFKEAGRLTEEIRRRDEDKKKFETELEALQAGLASAREALGSCRQSEQDAQAELLRTEESCALEELRVLRHQVSDLEELCKTPSLSSSDRRLFEQEVCIFQRQQEHLSKKHKIGLESLEQIPAETIQKLQECAPADESEESELSAAEEAMPNGTSDSPGREAHPEIEEAHSAREEVVEAQAAAPNQTGSSPLVKEPMDPAAMQTRFDDLSSEREKMKEDEISIDTEIEKACQNDDYELAEELEEKRKVLEQKVEAADKELQELKASLEECSERAPLETVDLPGEAKADERDGEEVAAEASEGRTEDDRERCQDNTCDAEVSEANGVREAHEEEQSSEKLPPEEETVDSSKEAKDDGGDDSEM
eukprot:TRINITY_DN60995_c0_g1_i1.p1 TRINITY_DN60995_c0_g1~~TRINITY_DN60995_c0_g1_i1.p1  ORF type:complete len:1117 (+),score=359.09 TRINITY_DN60995_c0_g1_i1:45-3395(+)